MIELFTAASPWRQVTKWDKRALALADRHYSRQQPGTDQFLPPGKTLVLVTHDERAVWAACENLDPVGNARFRCTIFRNEGSSWISSDLVRWATDSTLERWARRWSWGGVSAAHDRGRPAEGAPQARPGTLLPARRLDGGGHRA